MKTIKIALLGFGNVGKAFAQLLIGKKQNWPAATGLKPRLPQFQPAAMVPALTRKVWMRLSSCR